jgi:aryl-alcohol dehydrogenase-like predicted oxidoreductase
MMQATTRGEIMREIRLGRTELVVSDMALGTWSYGGEWGSVDVEAATLTVKGAVDLGINFFDTAQAYGFGQAERILADALWSRVQREDVVVAAKGGLRQQGNRLVRDASADWLRQGVEESLRHLRTDYIDLYQVHWPDPRTPAAETGAALNQLVEEGKIRYVGVSNYDVAQLDHLRRFVTVDTVQSPYHLFRQEVDVDLLPYCVDHELGVLLYGVLAHGLLSGSMTPDTSFAPDDWRSHSPDFAGETFAANLAVVAELDAFAAERNMLLPELAIAWTLAHPAVDVVIMGARTRAHLHDSVAAADVKLEDEDLWEIDRIMRSAVPVRGPAPEAM